jgi:hypothetical protein
MKLRALIGVLVIAVSMAFSSVGAVSAHAAPGLKGTCPICGGR